MATITVNGARIAYDAYGVGSPAVWVHGGFTDRRGAAASRRCSPSGAGSSRTTAAVTATASARRAARAWPTTSTTWARCSRARRGAGALLGNSDGGEVAIKLAVRRPELVASLCVHEPSLYSILPEPPDLAWMATAVAALERGDDEAAARVVIEDAALGAGAWDALPERTRRAFVHNAPPWLETARDPAYGRIAPEALAGRCAVPTLLTVGGEAFPMDAAIVARWASCCRTPGGTPSPTPGTSRTAPIPTSTRGSSRPSSTTYLDRMFSSPSVNLYVRDVEASAAFYRDHFGFAETFRTPKDGPPIHVELRLEGLVLGLASAAAAREMHGLIAGTGPSGDVTLWTDDVDATHAALVAAGAPSLSEPHDFLDGVLRAGWVADPDGNAVQVVQRR